MVVEEKALSELPFVQVHIFYRQWITMMQKGVWERPGSAPHLERHLSEEIRDFC